MLTLIALVAAALASTPLDAPQLDSRIDLLTSYVAWLDQLEAPRGFRTEATAATAIGFSAATLGLFVTLAENAATATSLMLAPVGVRYASPSQWGQPVMITGLALGGVAIIWGIADAFAHVRAANALKSERAEKRPTFAFCVLPSADEPAIAIRPPSWSKKGDRLVFGQPRPRRGKPACPLF